jgi:hypothetical protein
MFNAFRLNILISAPFSAAPDNTSLTKISVLPPSLGLPTNPTTFMFAFPPLNIYCYTSNGYIDNH